MTSSTTKGKIKKVDLTNTSVYCGYRENLLRMPDEINGYTKDALLELQDKINELIDRLNELERTKHG